MGTKYENENGLNPFFFQSDGNKIRPDLHREIRESVS